jgi:hypothetical protein
MRTHQNDNPKQGDVIHVTGHNGGTIGYVKVTDAKADGKHCQQGGFECKDATPTEIKQAIDNGTMRHSGG